MLNKIQVMLSMQDSMNTRVHPEWVQQNYEWYRAVWIECGELMDHQGYKWWKKQTPDSDQVKLEIIDIWHFGMSALFADFESQKQIAKHIDAELRQAEAGRNSSEAVGVRQATEALAEYCLASKGFSVARFADLMAAAELDFDELYVAYVGKNVLNFFRQDNGYKEGTYIKLWQGREDNEHLVELSSELDTSRDSFRDDLYKALEQRYQQLAMA